MNSYKLKKLGEKWLENKINRMRNLLKIAEPDEALYREIMLSLGYPKNKVQFLELALILPFNEIRKFKNQKMIERALLHRAGFIELNDELTPDFDYSLRMDKSVWDYKKIRPVNYPEKRISSISHFLEIVIFEGIVKFFFNRIEKVLQPKLSPSDAKNCVSRIMDFPKMGIQRKQEIFFNIILPFFIAYLSENNHRIKDFLYDIFDKHPYLNDNSITKKFKKSFRDEISDPDIFSSTKTYFGIIYLMNELQDNN